MKTIFAFLAIATLFIAGCAPGPVESPDPEADVSEPADISTSGTQPAHGTIPGR